MKYRTWNVEANFGFCVLGGFLSRLITCSKNRDLLVEFIPLVRPVAEYCYFSNFFSFSNDDSIALPSHFCMNLELTYVLSTQLDWKGHI